MARHQYALGSPARRGLALGLGFVLLVACGAEEKAPRPGRGAARQAAQRTPSAPTISVRNQPSDPGDPVFGHTLFIDDEEVPLDRIKRVIVMGPKGSKLIDDRILNVFIQAEINRRSEAGEDVSGFVITDDEVEDTIDRSRERLAGQFAQGVSLESLLTREQQHFLRRGVRTARLFDRLFLPENPYEWPDTTVVALKSGSVGEGFVEKIKEGWEERKKMEEETGEEVKVDPASREFINGLLRDDVITYLREQADIQTPEDGLPDEVAIRVEGHDVLVEEVWAEIEDLVTADDVTHAKQWIVNTTLARKALEEAGVFMSDKEFAERYAAEHDPYKDSPFSLELIAVTYRQFPNLWDYRTHYRLIKSYERLIEDEITDEILSERADRLDLLINGKVDVDIILVSAYDFEKKEWKENGWADAETRAMEITRQLSQGLDWDQAVEQFSEFYDPPVAKDQAQAYVPKNKGRFKGVTRAKLREQVEESDFSTFLNSASVADFVFFHQEMGTTNNPLIGPFGYYIPRMHKRVLPGRSITLENDDHRDLLTQEYVSTRFNQWVYDLRQQADLRGLPPTVY